MDTPTTEAPELWVDPQREALEARLAEAERLLGALLNALTAYEKDWQTTRGGYASVSHYSSEARAFLAPPKVK